MKSSYDVRNRTLSVVFQDQEKDVEVEVVYRVCFPREFTLVSNPVFLTPISTTRVDTREAVVLSDEQVRDVQDQAALEIDKAERVLFGH